MNKATDVWPAICLLGLGLYIVFTSQTWVLMDAKGPGPGLFPFIEGAVIIALSAILLVRNLMHSLAGESTIGDWRRSARPVMAAAALMASAMLLGVLGFVISFALLTLFIVVAMYRRPLLVGLATAIGSTAGLYLFFVTALGVRLPTGVLGF